MRYYRCRCGNREAFGSDSPPRCARCAECGSDLALGSDSHREPLPHEFVKETVETDDGPATLSRCRYCYRTKAELGRDGE